MPLNGGASLDRYAVLWPVDLSGDNISDAMPIPEAEILEGDGG